MTAQQIKKRREDFIFWFVQSIYCYDADPAVWMAKYINNRFEYTTEERFWFAWLYANTYNLPSAFVLKNEFPDFELCDHTRITKWNEKNYKRLRYQVDTKWNKGHFPQMFASYQKFIGKCSQFQKFSYITANTRNGTAQEAFDVLWYHINKNLYKFGRYSTWFYLQQLKHTCRVNVEPSSLMLSDYEGSRSHRNGLLLALGMDELVDKKLTDKEYQDLERRANDLLLECKEFASSHMYGKNSILANYIDRFYMETCLCSFKKLFRHNDTRFIGYYMARQAREIQQAEGDGWDGIDWNVLWQGREEVVVSKSIIDLRLTKHNTSVSDYLNTNRIKNPWEASKDLFYDL